MSHLQRVCSFIGRRNPFQIAVVYQLKRLETTQAREIDDHLLEWERARAFSEIPTYSALSLFLKFLPGGKFNNTSVTKLFETIYKEYGTIFFLPGMFGAKPVVISFDPEDFHKVYRSEGTWPQRRPFSLLKHHRGELRADFFQGVEGLVHTNGEQWGSFRSTVNPVLMQPRTAKSYIPKMAKVNWEFIQRIKDIRDPNTLEVPENFEEEINRYTLDSVSVVALDREIGAIKANRDNPEVKKLFADLLTFFRLLYELEIEPPLWKIISTPKYRKIIDALDGINGFIVKYIDETIQRLEKSPTDKPDSEKGVFERLLKIDKKIATVMAMDMLMVGVDTTTASLAGILLSLAKNPDKQQKLRDELRQILPQKESPFTEESMNKIPYLRACIKESLRMYPIASGNMRTISKDVVLSGYRIPKGTDISMVNIMTKDDPKYYVEPTKFLPERWLRRANTNTNGGDDIYGSSCSNPFVHLPFGFGPRMCVGRRIVELEMEIAIARIIRIFNVEFNYPTENAFKSVLINVPAIPLRFKFTDL